MKKYAIIITSLILISCSKIGSFNDREYDLIINTITISRTSADVCNNSDLIYKKIIELNETTEKLYSYTKYLPNNEDMFAIASILKINTNELINNYKEDPTKPSITYCTFKFQILEKTAEQAAKISAAKRRN
jgi:hypothetical protein